MTSLHCVRCMKKYCAGGTTGLPSNLILDYLAICQINAAALLRKVLVSDFILGMSISSRLNT